MASGGDKKMVILKSQDGQDFEVEEAVAIESQTIKHMVEDGCADNAIPTPDVSSKILAKIIEYCKKHHEAKTTAEGEDKEREEELLKKWDDQFISDESTLFEITLAANYLEIKGLVDLACEKAAELFKTKPEGEFRNIFRIVSDFTPEEDKKVRSQYQWAFDD